MGVFSERLFAVFIAVPWWRRETASDGDAGARTKATAREVRPSQPAWQTWDMQSPTTSTMRADLEALRTYTRVR